MLQREEKASVLLVDDDPRKLLTLENVLAEMGLNLVKANSGKDALRCLLKQDFAVILLDVDMPGMDGFEVASLIRQRSNSEHTPIIFVTAIAQTDEAATKGYSLGAVDYIFPPVVPEVMRARVRVFVDLFNMSQIMKRQADELAKTNQELEATNKELQEALAKTKTLSGLLPICAWCKKIRDDKGYWQAVEEYIREHSKAEFTHSMCPECEKRYFL